MKAAKVRTADELLDFLTETVALIEAKPDSPTNAEETDRIKTAIRKRFGFGVAGKKTIEREIKRAKKNQGVQGVIEYVSDWVGKVLDAKEKKDPDPPERDGRKWVPGLEWYDRNQK